VFAKENIFVNCICPAFVPTALTPAMMLERRPKEHITPIGTIMKAFKQLIDETCFGQVLGCSQDLVAHRPVLPYINDSERFIMEDNAELLSID
jgi:15-hydroxyprostaglandin dehydrogenase (NAD)